MSTLIDDAKQAKKIYKYLKKCRTATFTDNDANTYTEYISPPVVQKRLDEDSNRQKDFTIIYVANHDLDFTPESLAKCKIGSKTYRISGYQEFNGCSQIIAYEFQLER